MVDREARDKLVDLIVRFADGQITMSEFENAAPWKSHDEYVEAILANFKNYFRSRQGIEHLSGDKLMAPEERAKLGKFLRTLRSDQEYSQIQDWKKLMNMLMMLPVALILFVLMGAAAHWLSIGLKPVISRLGIHISHYMITVPMVLFGLICLVTVAILTYRRRTG